MHLSWLPAGFDRVTSVECFRAATVRLLAAAQAQNNVMNDPKLPVCS
jgi:hypothetical protein